MAKSYRCYALLVLGLLTGFSLSGCGGSPALDALCVIDCDGSGRAKKEAKEHAASAEAVKIAYEGMVRTALTTPIEALFKAAKRNRDTGGFVFGLALLAGRDVSSIQDADFIHNETWHYSGYWLEARSGKAGNSETMAIYAPSPIVGGTGTTMLIHSKSSLSPDVYNTAIACVEAISVPENTVKSSLYPQFSNILPMQRFSSPALRAFACGGLENRDIFRALLRENP
jgi:hypothetical protein